MLNILLVFPGVILLAAGGEALIRGSLAAAKRQESNSQPQNDFVLRRVRGAQYGKLGIGETADFQRGAFRPKSDIQSGENSGIVCGAYLKSGIV